MNKLILLKFQESNIAVMAVMKRSVIVIQMNISNAPADNVQINRINVMEVRKSSTDKISSKHQNQPFRFPYVSRN